MVSPALIQITVMSFIREYVSKRLRPQVVAMRCASGLLLLLWRRWRYTSQPVVDRYSIRFSFHGVVTELGLGIEYHHCAKISWKEKGWRVAKPVVEGRVMTRVWKMGFVSRRASSNCPQRTCCSEARAQAAAADGEDADYTRPERRHSTHKINGVDRGIRYLRRSRLTFTSQFLVSSPS